MVHMSIFTTENSTMKLAHLYRSLVRQISCTMFLLEPRKFGLSLKMYPLANIELTYSFYPPSPIKYRF